MLNVQTDDSDKRLFYAIGFSVYETCKSDITETHPVIVFIKEIIGSSPVISTLLTSMIEHNLIVRSEG